MHRDLGFLVLMLTERCNLACTYCYAMAEAAGADMPYQLAQRSIDQFLDAGKKGVVELAGGEPLLVFETISKLVRRNQGKPGLRFALQTNGILLDAPKLDFFQRRGVALGLSMDGEPRINDLTRGRGQKALAALTLFDEADVGVNVTVVLTKHNVESLPRFLLFLAGHPAVRVVNLDLVRSLGRAAGRNISPSTTQLENMVPEMLRTLGFINARRWPPLKVREIEQFKKRRGDQTPQPYCLACRGGFAAVTAGGEVFPCSSLIQDQAHKAGDRGILDWSRLKKSTTDWSLPEECGQCPARFYCRGGCPARRIAAAGSVKRKSQMECVLRRAIHKEFERQPLN